MNHVLFVGQDPTTEDYTDPALQPGTDAEKVQARIDLASKQFEQIGWSSDLCMIVRTDAGLDEFHRRLACATYDCVVIGGGTRLLPKSLSFFEEVVTVHKGTPGSATAFNTRNEDTVDDAGRCL